MIIKIWSHFHAAGRPWIVFSLPCPEGRKFFTCSNTSLICWESVTSIWNVFRLLLAIDFKSCAPCFVKQVANTWIPILSKRMAVSRPKPESHPVMKTYLVCKFCTFPFARNFKLSQKTMSVTVPARSKVWYMSGAITIVLWLRDGRSTFRWMDSRDKNRVTVFGEQRILTKSRFLTNKEVSDLVRICCKRLIAG